MGKLLEESDMPPLSLSFHNELRSFETLFERSLENCISGRDTLFDSAAAFEYARSYAVEFYKLYYNFYSQYPDYRTEWKPASVAFSLQRVLHCIGNYSALEAFFDKGRVRRITRTISDYAKLAMQEQTQPSAATRSALTGKEAAAYARAGVDMANASPLLRWVHEATPSTQKPAHPLADQIRALREESNLTTEQIAELIGIKPRNVYKHIAGTIPRPRQIKAYEEAFTKVLERPIKLKRQ